VSELAPEILQRLEVHARQHQCSLQQLLEHWLDLDARHDMEAMPPSSTVHANNEQHIRQLIDESPLAILVSAGDDDQVELTNRRFIELFGYTVDDIPNVGEWFKLAYPDLANRERAQKNWQKKLDAVRTHTPVIPTEARVRCKDGTLRDIEFHLSAIGDRHINIFVDFTARKLAEEALRESEYRFRMLAENSPAGIYLAGEDFKFIYVNQRLADMLACTTEDLINNDFRRFIAIEDRLRILDHYTRRRQGEPSPDYYQFNCVRADGVKRRMEVYIATTFFTDGQIRTWGQILDVTERYEALEALRRSEETYRSVVSALAEGIILYDETGRVLTCNASAERILGLTSDQLINRDTAPDGWQIFAEDGTPFPPEKYPVVQSLRMGLPQRNVIIKLHRSWDSPIWISINTEPLIRPGESTPYAVVTSLVDITERKLAEEALRERDRLRIAFEKEQELNTIKNRIMRTISHEFRTPLTIIHSAGELLDIYFDRLSPEQRERQLQSIRLQIKRLDQMVEEVSAAVYEVFDEFSFQPAEGNLNRLCEMLIAELQSTLGTHHHLVFHGEEQLSNVMVDERIIHRIMINLLSNAVKYSPADTQITVTLSTSDGNAVISVEDRGIGIAEDDQKHLFEPFFRASNVGNVRGTGMGLNIVRDCVRLHRGSIDVESKLNQGTRFTVRIPIHLAFPA